MTNPARVGARLVDAVRAEAIRTGGRRSVVWLVGVPLSVLVAAAVTLAVAFVAERFADIGAHTADPAAIQVTSVTTTNSVYWIITFTVTIGVIMATYAQAAASRGPTADVERFTFATSALTAIARWLYYGWIMAAVSTILVVATLLVLPTAFPLVYGGVDLTSAAGWRFCWSVGLYAFGACGFGIGIAGVVGNPVGSVAVLLGWMYIVETAISLAPNGYEMQGYMPFLNGIYSTGQEWAFTAPWSMTGGLAYFWAIVIAVFAVGLVGIRQRWQRM